MEQPQFPSETAIEECGICYLDFGTARKAQSLAACGHVMCSSCLQHLVAKDGTVTCPYCRAHSALPSDDEDGSSVGSEKGRSPRSWFKRLYKKSKRRRQGSLAHDDIRDLAIMSSFFI
ncbi:hypothetical protein XENTR_v10010220 [Xenopus tropicalis]|uniref:RING finger protein 227 n=3 Tax=Xenopus tropicalis TaxID=8364 RepID=A0A8J0QYA3_XENTR|nr:RING finger protein 227 [Xenopus tropicalis]KAE8620396.1 hypothetical protein XENTR_v10010220 [Xenopus tropicalis]|eukprot:XP_002942677.1 PREDICTED: E3 ubiquitin-protein ligase RNF182-like [Xenopus tropicalis]